MPESHPGDLRAAMQRNLVKHKLMADEFGLSLDEYVNRRCDEQLKFCRNCQAWVHHRLFFRKSRAWDLCGTRCKPCRSADRGHDPEKANRKWSAMDVKLLKSRVGEPTWTWARLAKAFDRSERAIKNKISSLHLVMGNEIRSNHFTRTTLGEIFGCSPRTLQRTWAAHGAVWHNQASYGYMTGPQLRAFLKRRPEAYPVMELPYSMKIRIAFNVQGWPREPKYKMVQCKKCRSISNISLHRSKCHCRDCGASISKWATHGYSDDPDLQWRRRDRGDRRYR